MRLWKIMKKQLKMDLYHKATTLWSMSKLILKIIFLGVILRKLLFFTKILILGLRIFKSQNLRFFFKIWHFGFVEEYLWESDNFWIKRTKRIENQHLNVYWIWKSVSNCFPENYFQGGIGHTQESVVCFIEGKDRTVVKKQ